MTEKIGETLNVRNVLIICQPSQRKTRKDRHNKIYTCSWKCSTDKLSI